MTFVRVVASASALVLAGLALATCGGAPAAQKNPPPPPPYSRPNPIGLWVQPTEVAITQGSSQSVAMGTNAFVGVAPANPPCPTTSPTTVQISGLPAGVTVSPVSVVIPADCSPIPVTFTVSPSTTAGTVTITLAGTSGALSGNVSLPFFVMPANLVPTAKCTSPPAPPASNPNPAPNEWTWMSGSSMTNQAGIYGTLGVPASGNTPGSRDAPVKWTDAAGAFWLLGGYGPASTTTWGDLNDLWKYINGEWTWVSGSNQTEQTGVYGTVGAASAGNVPGARWESASWTGSSGDFWLFGGLGLDSNGTRGDLNDLWKYDPATNEWAWMAGASSVCNNQGDFGCLGIYGSEGVTSPDNAPGGRVDASSWTDSCGNLWLFGGEGTDSAGGIGPLNDLWRYDPTTNLWTWMSGAYVDGQNGTYGTLAIAAPGNVPGGRAGAVTWTDKQGNLWLFGGIGGGVNGIACIQNGKGYCVLNDLWEYNPATAMWTWMGGSNVANQFGIYGTLGVASSTNTPGARTDAVTWTDPQGDLWLFGGWGLDSGIYYGDLNDLWEYNNGQWTWVSGSNQAGQTGTYGTMGVAAPGNVPGARMWAVGWIDQAGNLWLFGGDNIFDGSGKFNDLWEYQPSTAASPNHSPVR
jgi:N-acetylneuraminic acid mutarotase